MHLHFYLQGYHLAWPISDSEWSKERSWQALEYSLHSFTHSFIHTFIHSFIHSFFNSLIPNCMTVFVSHAPFQSVIALGARHFTVVSAAKPCNEAKNRSLSFIPMEPSRVLLPADAALEGASYINASWLPGANVMSTMQFGRSVRWSLMSDVGVSQLATVWYSEWPLAVWANGSVDTRQCALFPFILHSSHLERGWYMCPSQSFFTSVQIRSTAVYFIHGGYSVW